MKLSIKSIALSAAILWGGSVLLVGLANLAAPDYGRAFLELCASIYPGYHADRTFLAVLVGTLYALVDGGVGGALFAWIHNQFAT